MGEGVIDLPHLVRCAAQAGFASRLPKAGGAMTLKLVVVAVVLTVGCCVASVTVVL